MVPPTRRTALRILGTAGVASLAGCGALDRSSGPNEQPPDSVGTAWTPPDGAWHRPRADLRNSAQVRTAFRTAPSAGWDDTSEFAGAVSVPVATRDVVVSAERRDEVTRLRGHDPADGSVRWRREFEDTDPAVGGLVDGRLVVGVSGTDLAALGAGDGSVRWRRSLYDEVSSAVSTGSLGAAASEPGVFGARPLATPGDVYVQSSYGLHGLDPADGTEQWRVALSSDSGDEDADPLGLTGGLAVAPDRVWASYGKPEPALFEVVVDDGETFVDSAGVPEDHIRRPAVAGDGPTYSVAVSVGWSGAAGHEGPLVSAWNTGRFPDWASVGLATRGQPTQGRPTRAGPVVTDGTRYVLAQLFRTGDGLEFGLVALHTTTGGVEWTARETTEVPFTQFEFFEHTALCDPIVAGDTVLAGYGISPEHDQPPTDGVLVGYDATSGERRWQVRTDVVPRHLAAAGDRLYVGGDRALRGFARPSA
jgi:hypothetical protein